MKSNKMVMTPKPSADARCRFHTDKRCFQKHLAARSGLLRQSKTRGKDGDAGMPKIGEMGIVIVKCVTDRSIGHCGCPRR